jgi:hypothetical protein
MLCYFNIQLRRGLKIINYLLIAFKLILYMLLFLIKKNTNIVYTKNKISLVIIIGNGLNSKR